MMKNLVVVSLLTFYSFFFQVKESYRAQIAYKILETSPVVKKYTRGLYERVKKNGGKSFGIMLESSPNPKNDPSQSYSKTYNFNLHESYSDRMVITARFAFDPKKQQLYEYSTVKDILIPIAFDRTLLALFNKNNK